MSAALRSITGWKPRKYSSEFEDPLAYNKFVVFALVSSLLVPNAAKLFRQSLQQERFYKNNNGRSQRLVQRDRRNKKQVDRRTDKLVSALLKSLRPERHQGGLVFLPPHWTGEPRPFGARRVRLRSNFPSADYLRYLVTELGYRGDAAIAALSHAHEPWTKVSDRRTSTDNTHRGVTHENSSFSPEHPYRPASPTVRTTSGGGFKKQRVTEEIARHNWNDKTNTAVFEIVYMQREPFLVAASLGLKLDTVYRYCSHVRADLRRGGAPKEPSETPNLHAKNSKSFVLKEGVLIDA